MSYDFHIYIYIYIYEQLLDCYVVFTRRYRPPDGPVLCLVSIDVSGVCPLYVRGMSDVCPPDGESRTQRWTIRRTEGVVIIARDVMTYIVMT